MDKHIEQLVKIKVIHQKNIRSLTISLEQKRIDLDNITTFLSDYCARSGDEADYLFKVKHSLEMDRISIGNMLKDQNDALKIVSQLIKKYCNHEWIIDYIDIDVEKTDKITYCKICESSSL